MNRARVHEILDPEHRGDAISRGINTAIAALIVLNVLMLILETEPTLAARFGGALATFEAASVLVFTVEYLLRLWAWVPSKGAGNYLVDRFRFLVRPTSLVDLLAILPWYLPFLGVDLRVLRAARLLRLLRLLRLGRYSRAIETLRSVVVRVRHEIAVALTLGIVLLVAASTGIYYAEHEAQPELFRSIPASMWWGVMTLTTVGYGDVYPVTTAGRILGGIVAALGIGLFALPTAILGAGFLDELKSRTPASCPKCGAEIAR
jgi:voltage-gated potassium channel